MKAHLSDNLQTARFYSNYVSHPKSQNKYKRICGTKGTNIVGMSLYEKEKTRPDSFVITLNDHCVELSGSAIRNLILSLYNVDVSKF